MTDTIRLNKFKVLELQKAYDKAVTENKDVFIFDGKEFYTPYAKYLIQYAKTLFMGDNKWNIVH